MAGKQLLLWTAALLAAVTIVACSRERGVEAARDNRPPIASPAEQDFMMRATEGHLTEIKSANLALNKSGNKDADKKLPYAFSMEVRLHKPEAPGDEDQDGSAPGSATKPAASNGAPAPAPQAKSPADGKAAPASQPANGTEGKK